VPFWFLNTDLDPQEIEPVMRELRSKGINGMFMHPRTGMGVEYLSDEYWERVGNIVEKARELGMQVWLYDEYNWPSGAAGGRLLRDHPEHRQTYLDHAMRTAKPGKAVEIPVEGKLLSAVAVHSETGEIVLLEDRVKDNVLSWSPITGSWEVLVFTQKLNSHVFFNTTGAPFTQGDAGYLDLLSPEAVAKFIELTHEEYARRFKDDFGTTIPGIFTDEPANYVGLPWTHNFLDLFQQEKGYDLRPRLYQLVLKVGEYVVTRHDYHEVAVRLYETAFFKQIHDWCDQHGLIFTGHLFNEEDLSSLPATQGGFFPLLRHMHMPGTDYLSDRTGYESMYLNDQWGSSVGAKALGSTAHATGAQRALCEIFGGCGWQTSLAKLINVTNWATACGINFINPHASFISIKGLCKRDFPASHFVQEPWWKYYGLFSNYIAQQTCMSSRGVHVADVLLLYPLRTLWVEHAPRHMSERYRSLKDSFYAIANALLRIQRDYDFLFEELVVEDAVKIEGNRLRINNETFRVLMLPPTTMVPISLARLVRRFYENGGCIIAIGKLPTATERGSDDQELAEIQASVFGDAALRSSPNLSQKVNEASNESGGQAIFIPAEGLLTMEKAESLLRSALDALLPRDISIVAPETRAFIALHRRDGDTEHYFVANLYEKRMEAKVTLNATGTVVITDLLNEFRGHAPIYRVEEGKVTVPWTFEGGEGIWISISKSAEPEPHVEESNLMLTRAQFADGSLSVEGYTRETSPYVQVNGRRITLKPGEVLATIVLGESWDVSLSTPNTYVIDPWYVELLDAEWSTTATSDVDYADYLSKRSRLMLKLAGRAVKLRDVLRGGRKKLMTSRFMPTSEMGDQMMEAPAKMGFNLEEMGPYEMIDVVVAAANEAGLLPPTFTPGARYTAEASFNVAYVSDDITLVYEDLDQPVEITLNGKRVTEPISSECVWDRCNRIIPVKDYLKMGKNRIRFESRVPPFLDKFPCCHGLEPVVLRGSFMVSKGSIRKFDSNVPAGDWRAVGFPNYVGEIAYRQTINLPAEYLDKKLMLEIGDVRETVEVWLNGRMVGERIASPFTVDISEAAALGDNALELRVNNTAENLLGTPVPSGLLSNIKIVPYNVCKIHIDL